MSTFLADIPQLIKELGFTSLPNDKQADYLSRLEEIISSRINVAVLERLSEEGHTYFISLVEQGRDDDALAYVQNQISDLTDLVKQVTKQAIEDFLFLRKKEQS
ncbi:MAG: hypothetical protein A2571_02290 [Candidatus Vogelbacteria bacterium RIFOXYD1_FULL_44_32]|uniref:Uncharacterized protein n=1 Tax=Candidatus Vogelbacteria bacterium RIFOXYD1_FULL_44_32 TaxID=1802438 RepID=A0A1G2QDD1_9BACT|nr:MAG: hypothetical protein A2571_02290 [Candidatus Vogelbacteria bacterium RIFOXYD1_FULL_44_32]